MLYFTRTLQSVLRLAILYKYIKKPGGTTYEEKANQPFDR